jgi:hypothetical protein
MHADVRRPFSPGWPIRLGARPLFRFMQVSGAEGGRACVCASRVSRGGPKGGRHRGVVDAYSWSECLKTSTHPAPRRPPRALGSQFDAGMRSLPGAAGSNGHTNGARTGVDGRRRASGSRPWARRPAMDISRVQTGPCRNIRRSTPLRSS